MANSLDVSGKTVLVVSYFVVYLVGYFSVCCKSTTVQGPPGEIPASGADRREVPEKWGTCLCSPYMAIDELFQIFEWFRRK